MSESLTEFNVSPEVLISPRQQVVLLALLSGGTQAAAAEAAGVTPETVSRWVHNDTDFRRQYAARRRAMEQAHDAKLTKLVDRAFKTLDYLMSCSDDYVRLDAAKVALKMAGLLPTGTRVASFGGQVNIGEQQVNITKGNDDAAPND
jgi:transposase-like protein